MSRMWLLALLVLTAGVAAGLLFVKYQLEALRTTVQAEIEQRTGIFLDAESVRVDGLRGLRLSKLHMKVETKTGPTVETFVPDALLLVSIADLIQGSITISRIQLDDAHIRLSRPKGHFWFTNELTEKSSLSNPIPFRAVGQNCVIEIDRVVSDSTFRIEALDFDLNRLADATDLMANLEGRLTNNPDNRFTVFARYSSLENFDLRVESDSLSVEDLTPFFPNVQEHVKSGIANPSLRVSGYPRHTMVVGLELPFQSFGLSEEQPYPIPTEGLLTALASYDMNSHILTLETAKTVAPNFEGEVEGTVSFAHDPPQVDLRMGVDEIPMDDLIEAASSTWLQEYGLLTLQADAPYRFFLTVQGSTEESQLGVEAQFGGGSIQFKPSEKTLPTADLQFNLMSLSWHSDGTMPTGQLSLNDGTITHPRSGITAEHVSGTLVIAENKINFTPVVAQIAGNSVRGSLSYAMDAKTLTLDLSGDLAAVEKLGFIEKHDRLAMQGPVTIERLSGTIAPNRYSIDATADLTRTQINWEWWLAKQPGVGARIQDLHIDIVPNKSLDVRGNATLDTAVVDYTAALIHNDGTWKPEKINATAPRLDMSTVDKVLRTPYAISGGHGSDAQLEWHRIAKAPDHVELRVLGTIDQINLMPRGSDKPLSGNALTVDVRVTKIEEERTGLLALQTESVALPPFGSPWLLPMRAEDDPSREVFPPLDRDWTYDLKATNLLYPPWSGTDFDAEAYGTKSKSGFTSFSAKVGEGRVGGMYESTRPDNMRHLDANWEQVPASYLLEHLKLPAIFTGTMTGGIAYEVDGDDKGTLAGTGFFDVVEGQFSADYLFAQFARQIEEASITLPPSMKFSRFSAEHDFGIRCNYGFR